MDVNKKESTEKKNIIEVSSLFSATYNALLKVLNEKQKKKTDFRPGKTRV